MGYKKRKMQPSAGRVSTRVTGGPFIGAMNQTKKYKGIGMQLVEGGKIMNEKLQKTTGSEILQEILEVREIIEIYEYQKPDTNFQTLVIYHDGTNYKLRAIEEDGTVVVPTPDVDFSSRIFGFQRLSFGTGYLINHTGDSKRLHKWDGVNLTSFVPAGVPGQPLAINSDGKRLVISTAGGEYYSRGDQFNVEMTSWNQDGELSTEAHGSYKRSSNKAVTAIVKAGKGVIFFSKTGAERHIIQPSSTIAGANELDTRTSLPTYEKRGVDKQCKVTEAKGSIFFINEDGLFVLNPSTMQVESLIDETSGAIKDYWDAMDTENAHIAYSPKDEMIVICLKKQTHAENDRLVLYHISQNAFYTQRQVNANCLTEVNNQLVGGSAINGEVIKIFTKNTYTHTKDSDTEFRAITAWSSLGSIATKKNLRWVTLSMNLHPLSTATINIYIDGRLSPAVSSVVYGRDVYDQGASTTTYGEYVFAKGKSDIRENADIIKKIETHTSLLSTVCVEVKENSTYPFELHEIGFSYKSTSYTNKDAYLPNQKFYLK